MDERSFNYFLKNIHKKQCFDKLYDFYYRRIVLHINRRFNMGTLSEDVAQECFMKLLEKKDFKHIEYATSFELAFEKVTVNNNKRVYDSVTQDTLRFSLNLSKGSASIDMLYITNERYEYESNNNLLDRKKVYQGIEISYLYIYSSYRLSVNAYLENDGQKIIIEYQQRSMEDSEEPFWTFMNEFITVK